MESKKTKKKESKPNAKSKLLAVVRVRGKINLRHGIAKTFKQLNLHNKNWCVVLKNTESNLGMVKKVKDYVTYGELSEDVLNKLIEKRGALYKEREHDSKKKISYKKYFVYKNKKYQRYLRLNPPKKGYGRKGVKVSFAMSGALGYRGEKINDLLKRMI